MTKNITIEGKNVFYFAKGEKLTQAISAAKICNVEAHYEFMDEALKTSDDTRLILVPSKESNCVFIVYLYWIIPQDLTSLDQRVKIGEFSDDDFKNTIRVSHQMLLCPPEPGCGQIWHTLIIPKVPMPLASKMELAISTHAFKNCPNCGRDFRMRVVKVFDSF